MDNATARSAQDAGAGMGFGYIMRAENARSRVSRRQDEVATVKDGTRERDAQGGSEVRPLNGRLRRAAIGKSLGSGSRSPADARPSLNGGAQ